MNGCGCKVNEIRVDNFKRNDYEIVYCPKHAAADAALAACAAFEEAWEKSLQLEKTDRALAMAKKARTISEGREE